MIERERKFICWEIPKAARLFEKHKQFYLFSSKNLEVRVRVKKVVRSGEIKSELTLKKSIDRERRLEYTLPINRYISKVLLVFARNKVIKNRYIYKENNIKWEIDSFLFPSGLPIICEYENNDTYIKELPEFIKYEVTGMDRYKNKSINKYKL